MLKFLKMNLKIIFKKLILIDLLIIFAILSTSFFESDDVVSFNEAIPIIDSFLIISGVWVLALFVSLYLLYKFKAVGKQIYLAVFISGLILTLINGSFAMDSWTYVLDVLESSISGVLIFILYFTPIKKEFDK